MSILICQEQSLMKNGKNRRRGQVKSNTEIPFDQQGGNAPTGRGPQ